MTHKFCLATHRDLSDRNGNQQCKNQSRKKKKEEGQVASSCGEGLELLKGESAA